MLYDRQDQGYIIRFEDGETVPDRLLEFLGEQAVCAGSFSALGAVRSCRIAYFNVQKRAYEDINLNEQLEVLSLIGNVAMYEGKPLVHAHITLGRRDGTVLGGHLRQGVVRPTLELSLRVNDEPLRRALDPKYDLPSLDLKNRF